jgi:hypothetical protein
MIGGVFYVKSHDLKFAKKKEVFYETFFHFQDWNVRLLAVSHINW